MKAIPWTLNLEADRDAHNVQTTRYMLAQARKGLGVPALENEEASNILRHFGGVETAGDLQELLLDAINGLKDPNVARATRVGLGLEGSPALLGIRRERLARELNLSVRTLIRLEDTGLDELAEFLWEQLHNSQPDVVLHRMSNDVRLLRRRTELDKLSNDLDVLDAILNRLAAEVETDQWDYKLR